MLSSALTLWCNACEFPPEFKGPQRMREWGYITRLRIIGYPWECQRPPLPGRLFGGDSVVMQIERAMWEENERQIELRTVEPSHTYSVDAQGEKGQGWIWLRCVKPETSRPGKHVVKTCTEFEPYFGPHLPPPRLAPIRRAYPLFGIGGLKMVPRPARSLAVFRWHGWPAPPPPSSLQLAGVAPSSQSDTLLHLLVMRTVP